MGDSVKQFSLTIGVYMAAMGVGSYLSKYLEQHLLNWFIGIEIFLGLIGGASVPILYASFNHLSVGAYQVLMLSLTAAIGVLTGFEIPLLARILKSYYPLKTNLANVLSMDYIGALAATLLFPFLLLPFFGLFKTSLAFGLLNIALGFFIYAYFSVVKDTGKIRRWLIVLAILIIGLFGALLVFSQHLLNLWESQAYSHSIIHAEQTPYQQLVVTRNQDDVRLYLNRVIQFSSRDEYRYHESLALIPLAEVKNPAQVLILGGGEGLLAREVLGSDLVKKVTIVDLDERVFALGRNQPQVHELNEGILDDPRVETIAQDAALFLRLDKRKFDLILADLPDPTNESIARLYSRFFFKLVRAKLNPGGVFATQATSPFHTRKAFWCIHETVKSAGFKAVQPYHSYVPSFGDWGFVMAKEEGSFSPQIPAGIQTRFLSPEGLDHLFNFPPDIQEPADIRPNSLDQPHLLDYYLKEWRTWRKEKIQ